MTVKASDYKNHQRNEPKEDSLVLLTELAETMLERQEKVAQLEADLKAEKEALREVAEDQIPELMDSIGSGIEELKLKNGLIVRVGEKIRGNIKRGTELAAHAYLREHGAEALIKRTLTAKFGMGEDDLAQQTLNAMGDVGVEDKATVHQGSLAKWVRERLEDGEEVDMDLLGVFRQRAASIETS